MVFFSEVDKGILEGSKHGLNDPLFGWQDLRIKLIVGKVNLKVPPVPQIPKSCDSDTQMCTFLGRWYRSLRIRKVGPFRHVQEPERIHS